MKTLNKCNVAILAGGKGSRLKSRTGNLPKPMAPILDKPALEHLIALCSSYGFYQIALLLHYESDIIQQYFGDGSKYGVQIEYSIEREARGTAGALRDALPLMDERFLVMYGDTFADLDLRALWNKHLSVLASGTLVLHPNDHPEDSDLVELSPQNQLVAIHTYPHSEKRMCRNLVNAALYVLERDPLEKIIPEIGNYDLAKHIFPIMLANGMSLQGYTSPEYIKDMGTPERLDRVERDIIFGLPERLSSRHLRSAVFLDRDGTLNFEVNHLTNANQLVILPGAAEAVRSLNQAGFLSVCITNQPVVARGDVTTEGLNAIHAKLDHLLGANKAYLDAVYVCPHHPHKGFVGEVSELKIECSCRKPKTGLIDRATHDLSIDIRSSWMVGDTTIDIETGRRAGLRTILVRTGHAGEDGKYSNSPDYTVPNLSAAVDWILRGHGNMSSQLLRVCADSASERLVLIGGLARAGKTFAARVLVELMSAIGRTAHIISVDSWLLPEEGRHQSKGVCSRYDTEMAFRTLLPLIDAHTRVWIDVPEYVRKSRKTPKELARSIGPNDLVIVEGVTALMQKRLVDYSRVRIFIDIADDTRRLRTQDDYMWRGKTSKEIEEIIISREYNEVSFVTDSAASATHIIKSA